MRIIRWQKWGVINTTYMLQFPILLLNRVHSGKFVIWISSCCSGLTTAGVGSERCKRYLQMRSAAVCISSVTTQRNSSCSCNWPLQSTWPNNQDFQPWLSKWVGTSLEMVKITQEYVNNMAPVCVNGPPLQVAVWLVVVMEGVVE